MSGWKSRWSCAEVRERRATAKRIAVDPAQLERVRGDLHRARRVARRRASPRNVALEVDRLGRRAHGRALAPADRPTSTVAEQPARPPGRLEQRADEERRGRLAVGAGDPDDRQPRRRIAVEARRGERHRGADVLDHDLRHAEPERPRDDERRRAARDGVGREVVAVAGEPRDAEEQRAGPHRAVVVRQAGDVHVAGPSPSRSRRVMRARQAIDGGVRLRSARATIAAPSTPARAACRTRARAPRRAARRRTRRPPPAARGARAARPGTRARGPRPRGRARHCASSPAERPASRQRVEVRVEPGVGAARELALGQERGQAVGLAGHRAQHVERHHVARALPDAVQRRVAQQPRHRRLLDVAVAAQALERLGGVRRRALADPVLHDRGAEAAERARRPRRRRARAAARSPSPPRTRAPGRRARCASAAARPASAPNALRWRAWWTASATAAAHPAPRCRARSRAGCG